MTQAAPLHTSYAKPKQSGGTGPLLQRKCACGSNASALTGECEECGEKSMLGLQTKLAINEPGDRYEQEADRIADQVMRMPDSEVGKNAPSITPVQTQSVQRDASSANVPAVTPSVQANIESLQGGAGEPLPEDVREFMEPRLGRDLSAVRIHSNIEANGLAASVKAKALTVGSHIAFATGESPSSKNVNRQLLAHELVHTQQQQAIGHSVIQRTPEDEPLSSSRDIESNEVALEEQPNQIPSEDLIKANSELEKQLNRLNFRMETVLRVLFGEQQGEEDIFGSDVSEDRLRKARRAVSRYRRITRILEGLPQLDIAFAAKWLDVLMVTVSILRQTLRELSASGEVGALIAEVQDRQLRRIFNAARALRSTKLIKRGATLARVAEEAAEDAQRAELERRLPEALAKITSDTQLLKVGMSDMEIDIEIQRLRHQSQYEANPVRKQVLDAMIAGLESGKVEEKQRDETPLVTLEDQLTTVEASMSDSRETSADILRRMDVSDLRRLAETPGARRRLGRIGLELAEATSFQTAGAVVGALLPADVANIATERWEEERAVERLSQAMALAGKSQRVILVPDELTGQLMITRSGDNILVEKSVYLGGAPESFEPSELVTIKSVITGKSVTLPAFGLLYFEDKALVDTYTTWAALAELGVSATAGLARRGADLLEEAGETSARAADSAVRQATRRAPSSDLAARAARTSERETASLSPQELMDELFAVRANPARHRRGKYTWSQGKDGRWCRSNPTCFEVVEHADGTVSLRPIQESVGKVTKTLDSLPGINTANPYRLAVTRDARWVEASSGGRVYDFGLEGRRGKGYPDEPEIGLQRDIFEWSDVNIQRMLNGQPPIGVILHHRNRHRWGPLDELTQKQHSEQSRLFHGDDPFAAPVIRKDFDKERARYWVTRALDRLAGRKSWAEAIVDLYR